MYFRFLILKYSLLYFGLGLLLFAELAQASCFLEPSSQFKALGHSVHQGHEVLSKSHQLKTYRALDKKTGEWLELSWSEDCKAAAKINRLRPSPKPVGSSAILHDEDLFKALHLKQSRAFYLWSPRFTYSLSWMQEAKIQLEALGFEFVAAYDPQVSLDVARRTLAQAARQHLDFIPRKDFNKILNRLDVHEFRMRGLLDHYPQIVLVRDGKISRTPIQGLLKPKGLKRLIENMEWDIR